MQKFKILPDGLVKSGTASYEVSNDLTKIDYHIEAKVGWLFFTKTLSYLGTYDIDPELLRSETFKPGTTKVVGGIVFNVVSIGKEIAILAFNGPSNLVGSARINVTENIAIIESITAKLTAAGRNVKLVLQKIEN